MIKMSKIYSIRQLRKAGESVVAIAEKEGVSRDTVYKYIEKDNLTPQIPKNRRSNNSKIEPYKRIIDGWLDEDERNWRKQRHTSRRIWQRLQDEYGADLAECTVSRYVKKEKERRKSKVEQFLDLVWEAGEAQADFGVADFKVNEVKQRMSYFVLSFPHSNVGLAQVLPGENSECVCQGLKSIFEFIGGVPNRIVFDNATGVGRKISGGVRTTELFAACAAHYGFSYSFCNPNSGNEKGNVENKVGTIRSNLFVPVPRVWDFESFNKKLLNACLDFSNKQHWQKGENEIQLFKEDKQAMGVLPEKPFNVVRYEKMKTDKLGKVIVEGNHAYSVSPELAKQSVTVGFTAFNIEIYDENATLICKHKRQYGSAPTDSTDPSSQLLTLVRKINGWKNSKVRDALSNDFKSYLDSLSKEDLRESLRLLHRESKKNGWDETVKAAEQAFSATNRLDEASVAMSAARAKSGTVDYDYTTDLGVYDDLVSMGGGE